MGNSKSAKNIDLMQFDASGFARIICGRRTKLGWSTRDLAQRAKISQPYVVALERSRNATSRPGPTPTVEVVARLAHALGFEPKRLFEMSLQPASRHVLLVIDSEKTALMQIVKQAVTNQPDTWVCAGSSANNKHEHLNISLRKGNSRLYKSRDIATALNNELQNLGDKIANQSLGLIFGETSSLMTNVDNPNAVIKFEHEWADTVNDAATRAGAHALLNICVYNISDLKLLKNPIVTAHELVDVHDEVWSFHNSRLTTGADGEKQIIKQLAS